MNVQIMKIAPKMAEEWLSTSVGNPRWPSGKKLIDRRRVDTIAAEVSMESHLHFAALQNGKFIDPMTLPGLE